MIQAFYYIHSTIYILFNSVTFNKIDNLDFS